MKEEGKPVKAVLSWTLDGKQELVLHEGDTAEIGREAGNDLILPSDHISRKHAVIAWRKDHFEIQDLGSANGTSVNGKRLAKPRVLKDMDKVSFYDVVVVFRENKKVQGSEKKDGVHQTIIMKQGTQPSLVISAGAGEGRRILLPEGSLTIGRATSSSPNLDIALQDRAVSRPHARIENKEGVVTLADLGSVNGTFHNGQLLSAPVTLHDGDVILIGETTLIYRGPA
ncbi:MAG TPA: FHA domain-containing protein [Anaerolineales bacterium]|nr:FHA domain-containing protein [Anaerolineales bacterium]